MTLAQIVFRVEAYVVRQAKNRRLLSSIMCVHIERAARGVWYVLLTVCVVAGVVFTILELMLLRAISDVRQVRLLAVWGLVYVV